MRNTKLKDVVQNKYKNLTKYQKWMLLEAMFATYPKAFICVTASHRIMPVNNICIHDYTSGDIHIEYTLSPPLINFSLRYYENLNYVGADRQDLYINNDYILDITDVRRVLVSVLGRWRNIDTDYITDDMTVTGFIKSYNNISLLYKLFDISKKDIKVTYKTTIGDFVKKVTEYRKNKETL